ncbi:WD40 repeat domain-containing protein [Halobacillus sp. BBL2006]|uniref:WD40 repeat domain-containing protein n=1 Tax=Halobacillus sp. BBL2006 TaxID=1543706 RepID=UPI000543D8CD|nr:hypothetical protein [Halobacillus sp. BBL2006]KHE72049.1 hypothetical protein LD39_06600 [Halobacillus sp. BBL2006]
MKTWKAHSAHVNKVLFSPDSQYIVSAGFKGELFLWGVEQEEKVQVFEGHTETINGVCWFDKGRKIISASGDGTILTHEISSSRPLQQRKDLKSGVQHLKVTKDENYFITSTKANMITLWEMTDGELVKKVKSDKNNIGVLETGKHHNHAIIGGLDSAVRRFDLPSCEELEQMDAHTEATMGFCFFDEDRHAVSIGYDGGLILWDMTTHQALEKFKVGDKGYYGLDVSPDGLEVAITMPYQLKRISLSNLSVIENELPAKGNYSVNYSPDGSNLVIGSADKSIRTINILT